MNRIYFQDTDTLLFEFGDTYVDGPIDHVDLDYQTSLEFDCEGNLVALTIEHAKERGLPADSRWVPPSPESARPGVGAGGNQQADAAS